MTTQEVIQLNADVIASWNAHDVEKWLSHCDENIVITDTGSPEPYIGKAGAREFIEQWNIAFPDFKISQIETVANETSIAARLEFSGTNSGPLREIPATQRKVVNSKGVYFAKVKDGKVVELNTYPDTIGMMMQLGLMPMPEQVAAN